MIIFTKSLSKSLMKGCYKNANCCHHNRSGLGPLKSTFIFLTSHLIFCYKASILMLYLSELTKLKWVLVTIYDSIVTISLYNIISIHGAEAECHRTQNLSCWSFIIMKKVLSILANFNKTEKSWCKLSSPFPYFLFILLFLTCLWSKKPFLSMEW